MKTFLYICLIAGALAVPTSERMRTALIKIASVAVSGVEDMLFQGNFAEVRTVNNEEFDQVIKEPGRLVIVDFHHEETQVTQNEKSELNESIKRLPSKVIVAKVLAGRNIMLMDRLQIHNIPTLRVYRDGKLLEEFKGRVDRDRFISTVTHHLNNPNSKPHREGYIGPLKSDWMPEGIEKVAPEGELTPLQFDSN